MSKSRDRKYRVIFLFALVLSLFCMTIGYSAFRERMVVNSQAVLKGYNWAISFNNIKEPILSGEAKELMTPFVNSTEIDLMVELNTEDDKVEYTFDIENKGSIDAKLSYDPIIEITPEEYATNMKVEMKYANGSAIKEGDILKSKNKCSVKVIISYTPTEEILERVETVLNTSIVLIYAQK